MPPLATLLVSVVGAIASAMIGGLTAWLALRKRLEEESLGRATRRTMALQLLSDEEFTLEQVRDECTTMNTLVAINDSDIPAHEFLRNETDRVIGEARALLHEVRDRRAVIESTLEGLSVVELESVIARAYHGKKRAEAQLIRTRLSRTEVLKAYGIYGPRKKNDANP